MAVLASVNYSYASSYKGKVLNTKYEGKKHRVYFKVICDDFTLNDSIDLAKTSNNVLFLEYRGMESNPDFKNINETDVPIFKVFEYGNNLTEEDINRELSDLPLGVIPVFKLPDDFKDMHFIYTISKSIPRVRFIGGDLFKADGCNVGFMTESFLDKHSIKINKFSYRTSDYSDLIEDVDIDTLNITVSDKPEKQSKKKSSGGTRKASSGKTKVGLFSNLFSADVGF